MAKGISCKVKFERFKWNRGGYAEVMNGGGIQSMLDDKIGAVPDGYASQAFRGRLATGRVLKTVTREAYEQELRENNLARRLS